MRFIHSGPKADFAAHRNTLDQMSSSQPSTCTQTGCTITAITTTASATLVVSETSLLTWHTLPTTIRSHQSGLKPCLPHKRCAPAWAIALHSCIYIYTRQPDYRQTLTMFLTWLSKYKLLQQTWWLGCDIHSTKLKCNISSTSYNQISDPCIS